MLAHDPNMVVALEVCLLFSAKKTHLHATSVEKTPHATKEGVRGTSAYWNTHFSVFSALRGSQKCVFRQKSSNSGTIHAVGTRRSFRYFRLWICVRALEMCPSSAIFYKESSLLCTFPRDRLSKPSLFVSE